MPTVMKSNLQWNPTRGGEGNAWTGWNILDSLNHKVYAYGVKNPDTHIVPQNSWLMDANGCFFQKNMVNIGKFIGNLTHYSPSHMVMSYANLTHPLCQWAPATSPPSRCNPLISLNSITANAVSMQRSTWHGRISHPTETVPRWSQD